jgi:BlaI family transcriptional regulator, penicillinase repressor
MRQLSYMNDNRRTPRPNESELKLLRSLWQAPRLSAREIHDSTSATTAWGYTTTRKVLDRMEEKGLVKVKIVHGLKTYAAAQPKLTTLAQLIKDFASNVLDASAPLPVAAFAHSKLISAEEIGKLEALIRELDNEGPRDA